MQDKTSSCPLSDDTARKAAPTELRVIKTHLEWSRVPYTVKPHYICVIRDPKDTFVSYYHFVRDVMFGPLILSVPVWLLILTFEKMKADLLQAVRTIAAFMDVDLTVDEFNRVCEKSSFAYMKQVDDKFVPPHSARGRRPIDRRSAEASVVDRPNSCPPPSSAFSTSSAKLGWPVWAAIFRLTRSGERRLLVPNAPAPLRAGWSLLSALS